MPHNMTVTIEDDLWKEMKEFNEVRWSAVMKEAARKHLQALRILNRFAERSPLSEKEIHEMAVSWSRELRAKK